MKFLKKYHALIITFVLFIVFLAIGKLVPQSYINHLIIQAGVFAPIVFILLALIVYVAIPLSSTLVFFIGFFAFGNIVMLYTFIAIMISAIIDFLLAKKWGRAVVKEIISEKQMLKVEKHLHSSEYKMLFFLRLMQEEIFINISYLAGLTSMRLYPYFVITLLASIPGTIMRYLILSHVHNPFVYAGINFTISICLSVVLALGYIVNRSKTVKKLQNKL